MFHRQITPPSARDAYFPESAQSASTSAGSLYSNSNDSSPDSVNTAATTPPRSPYRLNGPLLLPKIRSQDLTTEPSSGPIRHRRSTSTTSCSSFTHGYAPYPTQRPPHLAQRGQSPADHSSLISPVSASSPYDVAAFSTLNSPITFEPAHSRRQSLAACRSTSASSVRGHSRSTSAASVDETVLGRYGYPTYRKMPTYIPAASTSTCTSNYPAVAQPTPAMLVPKFSPAARASLMLQPTPSLSLQCVPDQYISPITPVEPCPFPLSVSVSPPVSVSVPELPREPTISQDASPTTTLMNYLTAPNPTSGLVRRSMCLARPTRMSYYWWDVRNLRRWTDFNVETISSIPGLLDLLNVPLSTSMLPTPPPAHIEPESESSLQELWRTYHAEKVNSALRIAQGPSHMEMRAYPRHPSRDQADFVSNYQSDNERTIFGDERRGRVVGLVKSYNDWNSAMRSEQANKQVYYLQGLAQLHRLMREHGCRYGFIATEIELVCVRCGGPPSPTASPDAGSVPLFGFLELSAPIRLADHGSGSGPAGLPQMTADLALWYLHMLAKKSPLPVPGSAGTAALTWKMDVGGPAALTRQHCIERDSWIPKPQQSEKRKAKLARGWVWPEEPLNKKEVKRVRKTKKC